MAIEYEYYYLKISEDNWVIYKVDDYHCKEPVKTYRISRWAGQLHCTCPAGGKCKHIRHAEELSNPKKDLF